MARASGPGPTLEEELEAALEDALQGEPPGPLLGKRLERDARAILLRRGLGSARVIVDSSPRGTEVQVLLPPDGPRVREVRVRLQRA